MCTLKDFLEVPKTRMIKSTVLNEENAVRRDMDMPTNLQPAEIRTGKRLWMSEENKYPKLCSLYTG